MDASRVLVVMGVSGSGKSSVAATLADRLGWMFLEGDDLHPPANRDKLHRGVALDDADREPWLAALGAWIEARMLAMENGVVTCSALRRRYREQLAAHHPGLRFLYLRATEATLAQRLSHRRDHFMSPRLLHSQLRTLEEPVNEDKVDVIDVDDASIEQTLARAQALIERRF